jgi:hypothetical protein
MSQNLYFLIKLCEKKNTVFNVLPDILGGGGEGEEMRGWTRKPSLDAIMKSFSFAAHTLRNITPHLL